ncbi:hypothetical protein LCGC14_1267370, partial [marine sediment metagenome]
GIMSNVARAYDNLAASGQRVYTSMRDIAKATAEFSKGGFVQFFMSQTKGTTKALANLANAAKEAFGDENIAQTYMKEITQVAGRSIPTLERVMGILEKGASPENLRAIAAELAGMGDEGRIAADRVLGMSHAMEKGLPPNIQALVEIKNAMNEFRKTLANVKDRFMIAFGPDIVEAIKTAADWLEKVYNWVEETASSLRYLNVMTKVYSNNIAVVVKKFNIYLWVADKIRGVNREWMDLETELAAETARHVAELVEANTQTEEATEVVRELTREEKHWLDLTKRLGTAKKILIDSEYGWAKGMDLVISRASAINTILTIMGNNTELAGVKMKDMADIMSKRLLAQAQSESAKLSEEAIADAEKDLKILYEKVTAGVDIVKNQEKIAELNTLIISQQENQAKVAQLYKQAMEARLQPIQNELEIASRQKGIADARLAIAKATYGTAALGVKAQLDVVKAMQKEKSLLKDQLAGVIKLQGETSDRGKILEYQKKELDLRKAIADKTAEQLQAVRELRDGYLDAINAQAFGAGMFEKIIVSQEKNIGIALDKNIAKKSFLLGSTGGLGVSGVRPTRFGVTGALEMGGKPMTLQDAANQMTEMMKQMPESARAVARAVSSIHLEGIGGLNTEFGKNTEETARLNETMGRIADWADRQQSRMGILPAFGGRAGEVTAGEALRTGKVPAGAKNVVTGSGGGEITRLLNEGHKYMLRAAQLIEDTQEEPYVDQESPRHVNPMPTPPK